MLSGSATAIEISRAAAQLAARSVARSALNNELNASQLDGLKKTLGELRTAEADYIELAKSQRMLIERGEVEAIVGQCCSRLVRCLGNLENSIAQEFSIWLADPKVLAMDADARGRMVRAFVAKTCGEVRRQEVKGAQKLIDASVVEEGADENE